MIRRLAITAAVALAALTSPAGAHTPPAPGTGGWIPSGLRPDGLPITHRCGPITFSIDSTNGGVAAEIRNIIWNTHLVTGQQYTELTPGQGQIRFRWYWPPDGPDAAGYTSGPSDGWNWTTRTVLLNPARIGMGNLRSIATHEFGHALGMDHTPPGVWSVMGVQLNDWTMTDGAALLYLTGHHPEPGEPCYRSDV